MYENYLEDFVFSAAKTIAKKVLGTDEKDADATDVTVSEENKDNETVDTEISPAKEKLMKEDESQEEGEEDDEEDEEQNLLDNEGKALIKPAGESNFCIN